MRSLSPSRHIRAATKVSPHTWLALTDQPVPHSRMVCQSNPTHTHRTTGNIDSEPNKGKGKGKQTSSPSPLKKHSAQKAINEFFSSNAEAGPSLATDVIDFADSDQSDAAPPARKDKGKGKAQNPTMKKESAPLPTRPPQLSRPRHGFREDNRLGGWSNPEPLVIKRRLPPKENASMKPPSNAISPGPKLGEWGNFEPLVVGIQYKHKRPAPTPSSDDAPSEPQTKRRTAFARKSTGGRAPRAYQAQPSYVGAVSPQQQLDPLLEAELEASAPFIPHDNFPPAAEPSAAPTTAVLPHSVLSPHSVSSPRTRPSWATVNTSPAKPPSRSLSRPTSHATSRHTSRPVSQPRATPEAGPSGTQHEPAAPSPSSAASAARFSPVPAPSAALTNDAQTSDAMEIEDDVFVDAVDSLSQGDVFDDPVDNGRQDDAIFDDIAQDSLPACPPAEASALPPPSSPDIIEFLDENDDDTDAPQSSSSAAVPPPIVARALFGAALSDGTGLPSERARTYMTRSRSNSSRPPPPRVTAANGRAVISGSGPNLRHEDRPEEVEEPKDHAVLRGPPRISRTQWRRLMDSAEQSSDTHGLFKGLQSISRSELPPPHMTRRVNRTLNSAMVDRYHNFMSHCGGTPNHELHCALFEMYMSYSVAADEPNAPDIKVVNDIDHRPPKFEFQYSNQMLYTDPVPPPELGRGCGCEGPCDPESTTCLCVKRQTLYFYNTGLEGFQYEE